MSTSYAPPPGPPPHDMHYAPPSGPPPPEHTHFHQPPGPPPGAQPRTATPGTDTPTAEPPPPYTAKASDPLPSWAHASAAVRDLSAEYPPFGAEHTPLDPPPPFFSTPSPRRVRTHSFAPWTVPSRGRSLAEGFPVLYNDALAAHGVAPDDWARFVRDLQVAARLALVGLDIRGERTRRRSFSGALLGANRGRAYDASFAKSPVDQVQQLVDVYNGSAWDRRKVHVTLRMQVAEGGREGYELLVEAL